MDLVIWWLLALSIIGLIGGLGAIYFVSWSLGRNKQLTLLLVEYYLNQETEEDIK